MAEDTKDRITAALAKSIQSSSPFETLKQVGQAAAKAASSNVTFGDVMSAQEAQRLQASQALMEFLNKEREMELKEASGRREERRLGFEEDRLGMERERLGMDRSRLGLQRQEGERADARLGLDIQGHQLDRDRLALDRITQAAKIGNEQARIVSDTIKNLVPEEHRAVYAGELERLPYDVNSTNIAAAIGSVRQKLESEGRLPTDTAGTAAEAKVRRIMDAYGVSRREAVGIADGVIGLATDPQSGLHSIYDKATGQGRLLNTPIPSASSPAPRAEGETLFDLAQGGDVAGARPATQEALSGISGQLGGPVAENVIKARQVFRTEQQNLIRALSINPRFPVGEMERIRRETNIEPSIWDSPETLMARMEGVRESLMGRLQNEERAANDIALPLKARQAASEAANNIRNFLEILGTPPEGNVSLTPDDEALIDKYLQDSP